MHAGLSADSHPGLATAVCLGVCLALPGRGCSSSRAPQGKSARRDARSGDRLRAASPHPGLRGIPPERWRPLPARPLQLPSCRAEVIPLDETVRRLPPQPVAHSVPRSRWPALLELQRLVDTGRQARARTRAAELMAAGGWLPRYAAAILWSCPPCASLVIPRLTRIIAISGWRWSQVRWVLPLLDHPDEEVRAGALEILSSAAAHLGPRARRARMEFFLPWVRRLVADPSRWVRAAAVTLLGLLGDRVSHERLTRALADPSPLVRASAVRAIARAVTLVPDAQTTWAVCRRLRDPSPAVRAQVLRSLRSSPRACPLGQVARLLLDASRVRLRLRTPESGDRGLRITGGQVREQAWEALPKPVRSGPPGLPLDLRIARALRALQGVSVRPGDRVRLRPRPPASQGNPTGATRGMENEERVLRGLLASVQSGRQRRAAGHPAGGVLLRLRVPASRAALGSLLASLGGAMLRRALDVVARLPLEGLLLSGVVGLLRHPLSKVRCRALTLLRRGTRDDCKGPVLERALWLAREDPSPGVRAAALRLLVAWNAGPAVRLRVSHALTDIAPEVRIVAARGLLDLCAPWFRARATGGVDGTLCHVSRGLLLARLPREAPAVRAAILYGLIRAPGEKPPAAWVVHALDEGDPLDESHRASRFPSVRAAAVMALEALFGPRHHGTEAARAARWQDDLHRYGWVFPPASPALPPSSSRLPVGR